MKSLYVRIYIISGDCTPTAADAQNFPPVRTKTSLLTVPFNDSAAFHQYSDLTMSNMCCCGLLDWNKPWSKEAGIHLRTDHCVVDQLCLSKVWSRCSSKTKTMTKSIKLLNLLIWVLENEFAFFHAYGHKSPLIEEYSLTQFNENVSKCVSISWKKQLSVRFKSFILFFVLLLLMLVASACSHWLGLRR